ncbi:MAG: HD family phosphohydrolase [Bacillota bacterium]|nr:HD family phosphohydrolase [Bacillota bacterium]
MLDLKTDSQNYTEYKYYVEDLMQSDVVNSMQQFIHHKDITCLEHSIDVSYKSFLLCKRLGLDHKSAARGALLHDLFLYDWHTPKAEISRKGLHGFTHPYTALRNATKHFSLNALEKDIIVKHMWPLTIKLPKYKESFIVMLVDKYCAFSETINFRRKTSIDQFIEKMK